MVFCNLDSEQYKKGHKKGHNPYFNRWFSAILLAINTLKKLIKSQSLF